MKKVISCILTLTMVISIMIMNGFTVNAASLNFKGAQFYAATKINTRTSLTGSNNGYIDANDDCKVVSTGHVYNGIEYWLIDYPTSKDRKQAYAPKSNIISGSLTPYEAAVSKNTTVYKKSDMKTSFGTVYSTDSLFVLAESGSNNIQIIYPLDKGGFKIGWIQKSSLKQSVIVEQERIAYVATQTKNLNVRQNASASATVVGQFSSFQQITVIAATPENGFYKVKGVKTGTNNVITGYASAEYISFEKPKPIDINNITNAQTRSKMIDILYNGKGGEMTCDYDGYTTTKGRHNGIDFKYKKGSTVYSLVTGVVTNVNVPSNGDLSTIAIYDDANDKTVVYLHISGAKVSKGDKVTRGQAIAVEGKGGANSEHTHVEVRNGRQTNATKSLGENIKTLSTENPYPYWKKVLFIETSTIGNNLTASQSLFSTLSSMLVGGGRSDAQTDDIDDESNEFIETEEVYYGEEFYDDSFITGDVG